MIPLNLKALSIITKSDKSVSTLNLLSKLIITTLLLSASITQSWIQLRNDSTTPALFEVQLKKGKSIIQLVNPGEIITSFDDAVVGPAGKVYPNLLRVKQVVKVYVQDAKTVSRAYFDDNNLAQSYKFVPNPKAPWTGFLSKTDDNGTITYATNNYFGLCDDDQKTKDGGCNNLQIVKDKNNIEYKIARPTLIKTCNVTSCGGFSQYYDLTVDLGVLPPKFDLKSKISLEKKPGSGNPFK